uniref:Uncharacterized protein n=1 Tax=Rhizophora mucronata TaxID=61149 RepID=A0A2P2QH61_RHIMU
MRFERETSQGVISQNIGRQKKPSFCVFLFLAFDTRGKEG